MRAAVALVALVALCAGGARGAPQDGLWYDQNDQMTFGFVCEAGREACDTYHDHPNSETWQKAAFENADGHCYQVPKQAPKTRALKHSTTQALKHPSTQAPQHPNTQTLINHPNTQTPKHPSTQTPKHPGN